MMLLWMIAIQADPAATVLGRYVFTDEKAVLTLHEVPVGTAYTVETITRCGRGPSATGRVTADRLEILPLTEGIHIITLALPRTVMVRFLAMSPPQAVDRHILLRNLPHCGRKLLAGQAITAVAMGDSITNTGDYKGILTRLLARGTGNTHVTILDRSYPGRSVDAAVRFFPTDVLAVKPDIGLLMYGMNDLRGGCPIDGYVDQYRWIAQHLAADCHADTIFMTPTPDCSVSEHFTVYDANLIQTLRFGDALTPIAQELHVPVADTFAMMWGQGGASLDAAGKAMWPQYPTGYSEQFSTMWETQGQGDGVHPNVLGHLSIARAVFNALAGIVSPRPLACLAGTEWTAEGLVSHVQVRNVSGVRRVGVLHCYPLPDGPIATDFAGPYNLAPGQSVIFDIHWTQVHTPADLLTYPANLYTAPGRPAFAMLDSAGDGGVLYAVDAPLVVHAGYVRERQVVDGNRVRVTLRRDRKVTVTPVVIPANSEMGRLPLVTPVIGQQGKHGWAVAEVAYTRFGAARTGEAVVDGALTEWEHHIWSVIGEPVQARWTEGIIDHRATPRECYLRWSTKAGAHGLYLALQATGQIRLDSFIAFFDTRPPQLLGTPGRYYWVTGSLAADGVVKLDAGETSPPGGGLRGAWQPTADGLTLEAYLPYSTLELTTWPKSGDLGVSLWWRHAGQNGAPTTNLHWAEDGHPWNTRWYGVVRRSNDETAPLPYRVRIK